MTRYLKKKKYSFEFIHDENKQFTTGLHIQENYSMFLINTTTERVNFTILLASLP